MANVFVGLARRLAELGDQCLFRTVRGPLLKELSQEHVHLLDNTSKKYLLRDYIPFPLPQKDRFAGVLGRLKALSPSTERHFALKSDDVTDLKLRLYNDRRPGGPAERSYICLSYRWPKVYQDRRFAPEDKWHRPLPTSTIMFQAVLEELESQEEGLWLDQICINQDDQMEKTITIGAMDLIYKSARAVVVALDDIEISRAEASVLEAYLNDPYGLTHVSESVGVRQAKGFRVANPRDLFHRLVEKIISCEYFERAWCQHELRLGSHHVFLVRCSYSSAPGTCRILRFTGPFLYYMFLLYARNSPASSKLSEIARSVHSIFLKLQRDDISRDHDASKAVGKPRPFYSYLHSMAEVFGNKASGDPLLPTKEQRDYAANRDKISIILNTVDSGLVFQRGSVEATGRHSATLHECYKHMMVVALAAGDPVTLCTTGQQLLLEESTPSWLCWPHSGDLDSKHFLPMTPIPPTTQIFIDQSPACEFIELDLLFVGSVDTCTAACNPTFDMYLEQARGFLDDCINNRFRGSTPHWIAWRKAAEIERASNRDLQARTLAHAFQCGLKWIISVSEYHMPRSGIQLHEALTYLFGETLQSRRQKWWEGSSGVGSATTVLNFLESLTRNNINILADNWRPFSFTIPSGQRFIAFGPADSSLELAIPAAVRADEYDFLARCWLLQQRENDGQWTLSGKSHLYGVGSFAESEPQHRAVKWQQRVYGPSIDK